VTARFQTAPNRDEESIRGVSLFLSFPQWRCPNLTFAPRKRSHQELCAKRKCASHSIFILFAVAPEIQIKTRNEVMQVTDNPGGSIYRLRVMEVASAKPHSAILCVSHSIIIPLLLLRS
jgi:hypothetical protein